MRAPLRLLPDPLPVWARAASASGRGGGTGGGADARQIGGLLGRLPDGRPSLCARVMPRHRSLSQVVDDADRNVSTKLRQLGSAISGASDLQGGRRQRVDPDRWRRSEDLRLAPDETFGMGLEGPLKHRLTPGQKPFGQAVMDAVGGQEPK